MATTAGTTFAAAGSVVTPEAVQLDYVVGGIATRTFAKLIDFFVLAIVGGALSLLVTLLLTLAAPGSELIGGFEVAYRIAIALIVFFMVVFATPLCETRWNGRTPGKALLGLRAVSDVGETIGFRHAIIRSTVQLVEIPTGIALVAALSNPRNQRLGDLSAGTFVIHDRGTLVAPTLTPTVFPPPWGCEAVVGSMHVGGLSSKEFVFIRDFLLRTRQLTPQARAQIGNLLVAHLVPEVGVSPPPGMPPELYVNCVASAYQLRYFNGVLPPASR
jgi:uncharacterized RDD family membrane protein YckC